MLYYSELLKKTFKTPEELLKEEEKFSKKRDCDKQDRVNELIEISNKLKNSQSELNELEKKYHQLVETKRKLSNSYFSKKSEFKKIYGNLPVTLSNMYDEFSSINEFIEKYFY